MLKSNLELKDYSLSGYGWNKFEQEQEINRDFSPSKIGQSMSNNTVITTKKKEVKKVSNNSNILEPFVDLSIDLCKFGTKVLFKLLNIKPLFDLENYFEIVGLKNKQEITPKEIKRVQSSLGYTYIFTIPMGLSIEDFSKHKSGIEAQVNKPVKIEFQYGYIHITIIEKELEKIINYKLPIRDKSEGIKIPIGRSLEKEIILDLKNNPHSVVSGITGSGKSVCIKGIITTLMNTYRPHELEIHMIDFKYVELALFKNCTKYVKSYVCEIAEAKTLLNDLMNECKRRYKLFLDTGVTNIYDYNKLVPQNKRLKYQVILIEEFVEFTQDKKKTAMGILKRLGAMSRNSGQFLILTGQRFDNTIIDMSLRSNLSNRIIFQMIDEANSKLLLDTGGAENINIKGRCLVKINAELTETQAYYITDSQVKEYTKKYINEPVRANISNNKSSKDKLVNDRNKNVNRGNTEAKKVDNKKDLLDDLSFLDNL